MAKKKAKPEVRLHFESGGDHRLTPGQRQKIETAFETGRDCAFTALENFVTEIEDFVAGIRGALITDYPFKVVSSGRIENRVMGDFSKVMKLKIGAKEYAITVSDFLCSLYNVSYSHEDEFFGEAREDWEGETADPSILMQNIVCAAIAGYPDKADEINSILQDHTNGQVEPLTALTLASAPA